MIWEIPILLLAIPVGYLIAWMSRDELLVGRRWFIRVMIFSVVLGGIFAYFSTMAAVWACVFMFIVSAISWHKSFDKKWTKKEKIVVSK